MDPLEVPLSLQVATLFLLALPVACVAWTVTHEEVFREPREYCMRRSENGKSILVRKFFYLFTCEYCFSHYVTAGFLAITGYHLLLPGWRGLLIGFFALVWIANQYMSLFARLRLEMKAERLEISKEEIAVAEKKRDAGLDSEPVPATTDQKPL
ncbi:MAG: hypothetical protein ABJD11_08900 [Gemmatimonadota bacterium]